LIEQFSLDFGIEILNYKYIQKEKVHLKCLVVRVIMSYQYKKSLVVRKKFLIVKEISHIYNVSFPVPWPDMRSLIV